MTDQHAPADPYTTQFEATVEQCDGRAVIPDRTYFYAESGGQPADRGTLDGVPVTDVQRTDEGVVHTLAADPDLAAGDRVEGTVDERFRTYCMRAHTASHALYGAGRRLLSDLGYGGFDIDETKIRIDFRTSTGIDDATLVELERLTNRAVWEGRPVSWEEVSVEDARDREAVAFNATAEEGVFGDGAVRIVTIGAASNGDDWDVAACGGTHVRNTREIGPVTALDRSNPGEGLTRIELAVGRPAIDHRATTTAAALDAARTLGVRIEDLPEAVERRRTEIETLEAKRRELLDRVIDARITSLREETVERNGSRWLVGEIEEVDADVLGDRARDLAGEAADVVALVGDEGGTTLAVGSADEVDANDAIDAVTGEFGGGGGGTAEFAQGGGIDAPPDRIVRFLRGGD